MYRIILIRRNNKLIKKIITKNSAQILFSLLTTFIWGYLLTIKSKSQMLRTVFDLVVNYYLVLKKFSYKNAKVFHFIKILNIFRTSDKTNRCSSLISKDKESFEPVLSMNRYRLCTEITNWTIRPFIWHRQRCDSILSDFLSGSCLIRILKFSGLITTGRLLFLMKMTKTNKNNKMQTNFNRKSSKKNISKKNCKLHFRSKSKRHLI